MGEKPPDPPPTAPSPALTAPPVFPMPGERWVLCNSRRLHALFPTPGRGTELGGVSLGEAVAIWCRGQHQGMRFVLNKEGRHFAPVDSDGFGAVFAISNVSREDGGSYNCSYHSQSAPFAVSDPSDPVELVVRGEGPDSASPFSAPSSARPSRGFGANGTLRCPSLPGFYVGGKLWDLWENLCLGASGSVHGCSQLGLGGCPGLALTACLLCADPGLSRPSISLSPTGVTAPGADVTIWCQGQRQDVRFFLHKTGDLNPQQHMDPAGAGAEFRIPTVGRQHGGNYSCSYRPRSEPFVSSQPSDPVQLVIAGEGPGSMSLLPTPHPSDPWEWGRLSAPLDFTDTNIARLALSAVVLLVLGLILADAYYSCPSGAL
uniref:Immunoglobulin domain-containing protein n=1 Tax=Gopherus evgoodei TaxID=1825980 RepID=A0A8C4W7L4_9SAUR